MPWGSQGRVGESTYDLLGDVEAVNVSIVGVQYLGSLFCPSLTGKPPWRFGNDQEDNCDESDHSPLWRKVNTLSHHVIIAGVLLLTCV